MISKSLGLYVHIPFCLQKCLYCDFCSFADTSRELREAYVLRLCEQIRAAAGKAREYIVDTVYIGGGTPTVLYPEQLTKIATTIRSHYRLAEDAEFTVEANPRTITPEKVRALRDMGVNRLSLGLQSIHENEQKTLGRIHNYTDFLESYRLAREGGIENISVDLMYGIPEQTRESFAASVRAAGALGVQHVSAYALKIEPGTPFYKVRDRLVLPDEDTVADMYEDCVAILAEQGIPRYEISNFARPGYESRHNLKYWECDEYLGLGAAAHSYLRGRRVAYEDRAAFMSGVPIEVAYESVTPAREQEEYVMLGLRLERGVDKQAFAARFGKEFDGVYGAKLAPYIRAGFVQDCAATCRFTTKGFLVSNSILADVLDFD